MILIANHVSYIDWMIISAACPRPIRFIFDKRYAGLPVIGWFLNIFSSIPVSPTSIREMIRKASDAAREGDIVCIFPEGQLSRTGILNELKKGFCLIADKAETPVLPIYIDSLWGSVFSFERKRYFWKCPLRLRYPLTVNFGELIPHDTCSPQIAREALMTLSAESLDARPELQTTLDVALVRALKKNPGATCIIEHSKRKRRFKKGQILALAIALSSYWKRSLPGESDKIAVYLPPGATPIYINIGLMLSGKIPLNLPFHHKPDLDQISDKLNELGISTIITSRAFFPQLASLNHSDDTQYHLLDMRNEITAAGQVRIMIERLLFRFEPVRFTLRRLELEQSKESGKTSHQEIAIGFVPEAASNTQHGDPPPSPPSTVLLTHRNILANVHQLRSVSFLEPRELVFCERPLNDPAGMFFSLFLPVFANTSAVMRSFRLQAESSLIESILRQNSISTLLLQTALCKQILAEDRWHPELREQLRQLLTFDPLEKLTREELTSHCGVAILPCYGPDALGTIVAVSMPDPPLASKASPVQKGHCPDSVGKLLPGIAVQNNKGMEIKSTALPEGLESWHPLPEGAHMDEEGFVLLD